MFFDIVFSLVFGALAGMGIGGGGLLVIYLTLAKDIDQISAQALNLLFFVFSASSSLFIHVRKRKLDFLLISIFALSGIVGSLVGSRVTAVLSPLVARKLFGAMLVFSGGITLFRSFSKSRANRKKDRL